MRRQCWERPCCLPQVITPLPLDYSNVFRVLIMQFIDAANFAVRSIKKTCVHIVHPDGRRIMPFDTYNLFYRDELESTVLNPLRREREVQLTTLAGERLTNGD